jgi:N-methylhydantoinase A/oxoprolinase/acetone carboxylase beta subunit
MSRSLEVARLYRFKPGSGIPLRIPVVELCEIGAGGGSISRVDTLGRVQVGPVSAGSVPGPACYGLGGERPTLTDAHLFAGRLDPAWFAAGTLSLDANAAGRALEHDIAAPLHVDAEAAAYAVAEIADEAMACAAREHAIELGKSVAGRTLIAFGGSAPLHAARLAEKLGIERVVIPTSAGVGSAYGFLLAPVAFDAVRSRIEPLAQVDVDAVNAVLDTLEAEAAVIVGKVVARELCSVEVTVSMRYRGQGHELQVGLGAARLDADAHAVLRERFEATYLARFGRLVPRASIEMLGWSVRLSAPQRDMPSVASKAATPAAQAASSEEGAPITLVTHPTPTDERPVLDQSRRARVMSRFFRRGHLAKGASLSGPAVIVDRETTVVVPPEFDASVDATGHLLLERRANVKENV